jgi:hypothetical protein
MHNRPLGYGFLGLPPGSTVVKLSKKRVNRTEPLKVKQYLHVELSI